MLAAAVAVAGTAGLGSQTLGTFAGLGQEFDTAQARGTLAAVSDGITTCKATVSRLQLNTSVVAVLCTLTVFTLLSGRAVFVDTADLLGGTTSVVARVRSVPEALAVVIRAACLSCTNVLAVIASFASAVGVRRTRLTDRSNRLSTGCIRLRLIFGTEANGRAVKLWIATSAVFHTLVLLALEATTLFLRIGQTTVVGDLTAFFAKSNGSVAVLSDLTVAAGLALVVDLAAAVFAELVPFAFAVTGTGASTLTATASQLDVANAVDTLRFAVSTVGVFFAGSSRLNGAVLIDLTTFDAELGAWVTDLVAGSTVAVVLTLTWLRTVTRGGHTLEGELVLGFVQLLATEACRTEGVLVAATTAVLGTTFRVEDVGNAVIFLATTLFVFGAGLADLQERTTFANALVTPGAVNTTHADAVEALLTFVGAKGHGTDLTTCVANPVVGTVFGLFTLLTGQAATTVSVLVAGLTFWTVIVQLTSLALTFFAFGITDKFGSALGVRFASFRSGLALLLLADLAFFAVLVGLTGGERWGFGCTSSVIGGVGVGVTTRALPIGAGLTAVTLAVVGAGLAAVRTVGYDQGCKHKKNRNNTCHQSHGKTPHPSDSRKTFYDTSWFSARTFFQSWTSARIIWGIMSRS